MLVMYLRTSFFPDGDTLTDEQELTGSGTDPDNSDTDGDGEPDNTDPTPNGEAPLVRLWYVQMPALRLKQNCDVAVGCSAEAGPSEVRFGASEFLLVLKGGNYETIEWQKIPEDTQPQIAELKDACNACIAENTNYDECWTHVADSPTTVTFPNYLQGAMTDGMLKLYLVFSGTDEMAGTERGT